MGSVADRGSDVDIVVPPPHPPAGLVNRCTAPRCVCEVPSPFSGFPIATMLPSLFTDTDRAKSLSDVPVATVSRADVDVATHPVVGFVYTNASPLVPLSLAPTTIVLPSPLTDTDSPKSSLPVGLGLVSFAPAFDAAHPVAGLVNTYAPSVPEAFVPTTIVSPFALTDTQCPKNSFAVLVGGMS